MEDVEFWHYVESLRGAQARADGEFWVYLNYWDVYRKETGPYKAVVHSANCTWVQNRKLKVDGIGYKNGWTPFSTLQDAEQFAGKLHQANPLVRWHHDACLKGRT